MEFRNMQKELPKRKATRLRDFSYNTAGAYFITICTLNREHILSQIVGDNEQSDKLGIVGGGVPDAPKNNVLNYDLLYENAHIELLPFGQIADKYINQLDDFYDDIKVEQYVIMPNHIHIMLVVLDDKTLCNRASGFGENGASRTPPPTGSRQNSVVSSFVSTFKRFCNKECGYNIWQRHFNDHIIRNQEDYETHLRYILENPMRWHFDELYSNNILQ
ncbi:MAG: hypothetical protein IJ045_08635 [Ruminiclostridium sp.]|nr:hypothetical protein [Ruminiclostridium sp.]